MEIKIVVVPANAETKIEKEVKKEAEKEIISVEHLDVKNNKLFIITLGTSERPATNEDLSIFGQCLGKAFEGEGLPIVVAPRGVSVQEILLD